jgi:Fe2+ or Zn2+ uptake regulation protein
MTYIPQTEVIAMVKKNIKYRTGQSFTVDEFQRSQMRAKKLGHSRLRQILNIMADDGLLDKIGDGDFVAYRKRTSSRHLLCSKWAKVTLELQSYTPRWY